MNATISFPPLRKGTGTITVTASDSVPSSLVVLGKDELLAFHDSTVLIYLALRPLRNLRLTEPPRVTFSLPTANAGSIAYDLSYRGPDADSWSMPGYTAWPVKQGPISVVSFGMMDLPLLLRAGKTQNFVLYQSSQGAA